MRINSYQIANVVAYLFHPIFIPCYYIFILFWRNYIPGFNRFSSAENIEGAVMIIVLSCTFISFIPLLLMLILVKLKIVSSIQAKVQRERSLPFLSALVSGLFGFILIHKIVSVPPVISLFYIGYLFAIGIALLVNNYSKISIHMIGIGGVLGSFIALSKLNHTIYLPELYLILGLSGLIAFSRLRLQAHTPAQIGFGFVVGILCEVYPLYFI